VASRSVGYHIFVSRAHLVQILLFRATHRDRSMNAERKAQFEEGDISDDRGALLLPELGRLINYFRVLDFT
jgi:hypothetical protein